MSSSASNFVSFRIHVNFEFRWLTALSGREAEKGRRAQMSGGGALQPKMGHERAPKAPQLISSRQRTGIAPLQAQNSSVCHILPHHRTRRVWRPAIVRERKPGSNCAMAVLCCVVWPGMGVVGYLGAVGCVWGGLWLLRAPLCARFSELTSER